MNFEYREKMSYMSQQPMAAREDAVLKQTIVNQLAGNMERLGVLGKYLEELNMKLAPVMVNAGVQEQMKQPSGVSPPKSTVMNMLENQRVMIDQLITHVDEMMRDVEL